MNGVVLSATAKYVPVLSNATPLPIQGVANAVSELLSEAIGEQDEAVLSMLQTELRTVRKWILGNKQSPKVIFEKLESVRQQIENIEHRGIQNAVSILQGTATELAQIAGQHTVQMLETVLDNERAIRRKHFKSELTDTAIKNMLDYKPFVDGKTIQQVVR